MKRRKKQHKPQQDMAAPGQADEEGGAAPHSATLVVSGGGALGGCLHFCVTRVRETEHERGTAMRGGMQANQPKNNRNGLRPHPAGRTWAAVGERDEEEEALGFKGEKRLRRAIFPCCSHLLLSSAMCSYYPCMTPSRGMCKRVLERGFGLLHPLPRSLRGSKFLGFPFDFRRFSQVCVDGWTQ